MAAPPTVPHLRFSCQGVSCIVPIQGATVEVCDLISDYCGKDFPLSMNKGAWYVSLNGGGGVTGCYSFNGWKCCKCKKYSVRYQVPAPKE